MRISKAAAFAFVLLLLCFNVADAQKAKNYHGKPYWVNMMDDPNVNYYEACKAYDQYWKGREQPRGEDEVIGQKENLNSGSDKDHFKATHKSKKEKKEEVELQKYVFLIKKFENWRRANQPYVKPDGHIMNAQERLNIWRQQKEGR